jgi:hypothetical protein
MVGMFKQLDSWMKGMLPVLPLLEMIWYYLERNMVGMFKQLDSWVKGVLPVLPFW